MIQPTVEIFYACDEKFLKYTEVSLHSMMKNASGERNYHVHILHTGISEDSEKRVMAKATDSFKITFDDVTGELETLSDRLPLRDYYSNSTYFRLFIADMYPELDKAIYIDGDTVVNGDISELFDTDVTKYDVAACREQAIVQEDVYGTYVEKCLGLDRNAYFNAGVLLLNCKRFRGNKMLERFSELLEIYNCRVTQDEDYLNIMFKDHVLFLPQCWNSEVFGEIEYSEEESKIIHYIMVAKPWHYADCRYAESFWRYAEETNVIDDLKNELASYTEEQRARDAESCVRLMELARSESKRPDTYLARISALRSAERLAIKSKIELFEKEGRFDEDVEDDPPTRPIKKGEVDFFCTRPSSRLARRVAYYAAHRFVKRLVRDGKLIISEIKGLENLKNLDTGAIITCNHFNAFDSFAVELAYEAAYGRKNEKRLYRVIREGNYTSFPGFYGFLMRHCNTLPLASSLSVLREFNAAVETLLSDGNFVLVYPEQSMWWNYRKPKPLKPGAFRFSARTGVPTVPVFITMKDSKSIGEDGFPIQEYTVHICKPIYPDTSLSSGEAISSLMAENARAWREVYEREYGIALSYTTEKSALTV
jgi:lipopolysaccharide biosynthesis glycosyltransferase/1-acyl-sn-glycerol-3-phosphate acyltransferase